MRYLGRLPVLLLLFLIVSCGSRRPSAPLRQQVVPKAVMPEVIMQHDYYTHNDSIHFFLRFEDARQVLDIARAGLKLEYIVRGGGAEKSVVLVRDSIQAGQQMVDADGGLHYNISLPAMLAASENTLELRLWQRLSGQERMGALFSIPLRSQIWDKRYLLMRASSSIPLVRDYVNLSDPLLVRQLNESESLTLQRYDADFAPALPPMAVGREAGSRTIKVSETYTFSHGDTLVFPGQGLYLMEPNSSLPKGLLVKPNLYPLVTKPEELVEPLIYITTAKERASLTNAADPKAAVDEFWLRVAGNKTTARELIRIFYSRVEAANRLFTSHKAGWATDRGMIYIIYGQPNSINQNGDKITWIYRESELSPSLRFVFIKKPNNFTENHYELVRNLDYEESWYSTVAKWRAGITDV